MLVLLPSKQASKPSSSVDASGVVTAQYVYGMRSNVPDFMIKGNKILRFIVDHQGLVRLVVDTQTGAILQAIDSALASCVALPRPSVDSYDVFGKKIRDTNPGFQPFGFAGGLHDKDTGFVQFPQGTFSSAKGGIHLVSARDYDPESGRWMAKDPLGFGGGDFNLYTYASNDSVNQVDPTGLAAQICRDGNVVKITLFIRYDLHVTDKWDRAIEKAWSGKFGKYEVFTRVENPFFPGGGMGSKWNTVDVNPYIGKSHVENKTNGHWKPSLTGNQSRSRGGSLYEFR